MATQRALSIHSITTRAVRRRHRRAFAALVVLAAVRRRDIQPHLSHGADLAGLSRIGLRTRPAESD